ncbi:MAG TPA: hypothetical protein VMU54_19235, partial [Planctomycetota bacterium]|nr:hypothetical protein [Planctomycetota bacterium]
MSPSACFRLLLLALAGQAATLSPLFPGAALPAVALQEVDKILEQADKLLEEAKADYENARAQSSGALFVEAGFKLEEARIKYLVLQEIGQGELPKTAADRLRAVNQLSKLIHDGKVAVAGSPVEAAPEKPDPAPKGKPADSKPPAPVRRPDPPAAPAVDVSKRSPIPDSSRQKDAEKQIRDLYKEQYAKKTPADRKALARLLLDEAVKSGKDPVAYWVFCKEAQDAAVQACDPATAVDAIDTAALLIDCDPLALKSAALAASLKTARTAEDMSGLVESMLRLVDDLVRVDQYGEADKTATSALSLAKKAADGPLIARASTRAKEVADAKTLYQGLKGVLETLARTPEDGSANLEMGKYLCYVKGMWDLGLRFIDKSSDAALKSLAQKELALPTQSAELAALGDGWWDLAEKEKSPLRRGQLLAHARNLYDAALPDAPPLIRAKIEKRLDAPAPGSNTNAPVDLLSLVDLKKDVYTGAWKKDGAKIISPAKAKPVVASALRVPYLPPAEYDLKMVVEWKGETDSGAQALDVGLVGLAGQFTVTLDGWAGGIYLNSVDG